MPFLQPRIAEYFDDGELLHQKLLHVILQVIDDLEPCKILQFGDQPRNPIVYEVDSGLTDVDIEVAELQILPFLEAAIELGHQLPELVIGLDYPFELNCVCEDGACPLEVLLLGVEDLLHLPARVHLALVVAQDGEVLAVELAHVEALDLGRDFFQPGEGLGLKLGDLLSQALLKLSSLFGQPPLIPKELPVQLLEALPANVGRF